MKQHKLDTYIDNHQNSFDVDINVEQLERKKWSLYLISQNQILKYET